jgi:hypothetical protein
MNHIYGVNKYIYARYCTETDIFLKTTRAGSGSGFGGEISGSGKKIRIRNTGYHKDIFCMSVLTYGDESLMVLNPYQ